MSLFGMFGGNSSSIQQGINAQAQQQLACQNMSGALQAAQGGSTSIGSYTGSPNIGNAGMIYSNGTWVSPNQNEMIKVIILGQMTKHNIKEEHFPEIKKEFYSLFAEQMLSGYFQNTYQDWFYTKAEETLPTWKFKNDMSSLLNEEESEKK